MSKIRIEETRFQDLLIVEPFHQTDKRGEFVKIYNRNVFASYKLATNFVESYYSVSSRNVIRGMHFQIPPFDHEKLVFVVDGKIMDIVVDLREGSETFGECFSIKLDSKDKKVVYIPKGFAHGFKVLDKTATVFYMQSSVYSQKHDKGIKWDSIPFDWQIDNPVISERDSSFMSLKEYLQTENKFRM